MRSWMALRAVTWFLHDHKFIRLLATLYRPWSAVSCFYSENSITYVGMNQFRVMSLKFEFECMPYPVEFGSNVARSVSLLNTRKPK